ncbi:MAG: outer membrane protein assembly factor BamC [Methylophaga sp.]|nr:outer membrane protein assembly factor BamC [Methylophaga sp.]
MNLKTIISISLTVTLLSGCGAFSGLDQVVPDNSKKYRKAETMPPLDVPPDLSSESINDEIAGNQKGSATYSEFEEAATNPLASKYNIAPEVKPSLSGEGAKRHLVIPGDREVTWQRLLDFWSDKGVAVKRKDLRIGLMDTEVGGDAYAYRLRMERGDTSKIAKVYVSAAGMEDNAQKNEAMLRQIADYLGGLYQQDKVVEKEIEQSQPQVVAVSAVLIDEANDHKALLIDQDFPDVWQRTGRILDSKGFAVEEQDRSRGIYFVHYLDPFNKIEKDEEGILSKLAFWRDDEEKAPTEYYYIKLISDAEKTKMIILDADETRTSSDTAKRLLGLMQEQLSK